MAKGKAPCGLLLFSLLLSPLSAQKVWVRMSAGISQAAGILEHLEAPEAYRDFVALGDRRGLGWGEGLGMEFGVTVLPRLSLSVGSGYSRHKRSGKTSPFFSKEYLDSEFARGLEDFYTVVPDVKLETTFFFLAASYSIPLRGGIAANLTAGTAYYLGTFESTARWDSYHPVLDRNFTILCDLKTWGYFIGGGFDFKISRHLTLTIEALHRMAVFDTLEECEIYDDYIDMGDQTADLFPEFAYSITDMSFSGLSLQAGIKLFF